MKIHELCEGILPAAVGDAMRGVYALKHLDNQDPYRQYRFAQTYIAVMNNQELPHSSSFGEHMIIGCTTDQEQQILDKTIKAFHGNVEKVDLSNTPESTEPPDTNIRSIIGGVK